MRKNEGNPCPGCKKHKTRDAAWMFFTDEELQAIKASNKARALLDAQS